MASREDRFAFVQKKEGPPHFGAGPSIVDRGRFLGRLERR